MPAVIPHNVSVSPSVFKRLGVFLGLNFCLSLLIGSFYLLFAGKHPLGFSFAVLALVSNTAMIYAALSLVTVPFFFFAQGRVLVAALTGALQIFLVTDAAVYKIFKIHFNSMVLNLLLTPGGFESLDQGWGTKAIFVLVVCSVAFLQWYFWRISEGVALRLPRRRITAVVAALLLAFATDKAAYAWGSLYDAAHITRNSQLFPLYQRFTIRSFASKHLGVKLDNEVSGGVDARYSGLVYPKAELTVDVPQKPFNILFIVVDSMRYDMLNAEVMPESSRLARGASVFTKHYSGGNCTRFGIFSMIYGLYGNYWFPMLGERRGPVLIDVLKKQGYDLRLFAATKLSFPEFNKTCFVDVPREGIYDEPPGGDGAARDSDISKKLMAYLQRRDAKRPYFAFLFYDASHGSYDYPPGFDKFKPAAGVNLLRLNKDNVGPLFNKYRNSVHYDDHLIGRILETVRETGGMENTVIIIAGDHGEPFFEKGYYGHNQAYSSEEVRVPLVLYVPGRAPAAYTGVTSHMDIPVTLLGLAGVKNPPADYSNGQDLFAGKAREFIPAFSWDTAALIRGEETLVVPLEAYKGGVRVYDGEYREMGKENVKRFAPLLLSFQREAKSFTK